MSALTSLTEEATRLQAGLKDTLLEQRQAALTRFQENGFPTQRDEHWKYTDLRRITNKSFTIAGQSTKLTQEQLATFRFDDLSCHELVFHNGQFQSSLSNLDGLTEDIIIEDLASAIDKHGDLIEQHINLSDDERSVAFSTLNSAFLQQGSFIHLPDNVVLDKPIHLLYLSGHSEETLSSQPRNIIVFGKNAEATIIESYMGVDDGVYFTNAVSEISLAANSQCKHYKLQQESNKAFHVGSIKTAQQQDSRLESHFISLGAALARNDIHAQLKERGSHILMNGLYMASGKQHIDNHTLVDHLVPHTSSEQVYRGVLNGHGRGVFNGKVIVHKDAQKTEAHQSNANLLLSDTAEVDTKPELEIYADDVKCSHGATVGQLDQNMLFYLRSRAIEEETAKRLLTYAFADEVISKINFQPIRKRLEQVVIGKLPDADLIQDFAHD